MWVILETAGRRRRVPVARGKAGVYVGYPGGVALVGASPRQRRSAQGGLDPQVRAPMTGRVVSVAVARGDHVAVGAPLVVLEAMKMEYRLAAPHAGTVGAVTCEAGQRVELGDVLVTLAT